MSADADHEVIDSPEALFRHLYEEHGVEEALDLDPETAPVQFWSRRHAELERAQRLARRREESPGRPVPDRDAADPAPPGDRPRPQPEAQVRREPPAQGPGRRPAPFGDPLVEAMARALAGRGHDEAAVRAAIRSFAAEPGLTGEAAVSAAFVEPMLRAAAEQLLGRPTPTPAPAPAPARAPTSTPPPAPAPAEPAARPEAAWAVLWADLAESGTRGGTGGGAPGDDGDDLMAVADAVQQRRRVRTLRR